MWSLVNILRRINSQSWLCVSVINQTRKYMFQQVIYFHWNQKHILLSLSTSAIQRSQLPLSIWMDSNLAWWLMLVNWCYYRHITCLDHELVDSFFDCLDLTLQLALFVSRNAGSNDRSGDATGSSLRHVTTTVHAFASATHAVTSTFLESTTISNDVWQYGCY
jgi:hypothetical protein